MFASQRADKVRNVHAWARGNITTSGMGTDAREASNLCRIRYSLSNGIFHHDLTVMPIKKREVKGGWIIAFNTNGVFGAYFY